MSIRQRTTRHHVEKAPKLVSVTGNRSRSSKTHWTWWIRTVFIVTCAAALFLVSLHWTRSSALTHLPHERGNDNSNGPPFILRDLPGRGKGLVAIRDIRRGELLIRDRPLFLVPHEITTSPAELILDSVQQLPSDQAAAFYNLSHMDLPENFSPEEVSKWLPLYIFLTNAAAAGPNVGLFPTMARLNHGCSGAFNAVYTWREREGVLYVYAFKDIKSGEEVLTSYFGTMQTRDERRRLLMQNYGFHCMCAYCALPDEESRASDTRLTTMSDLYKRFGTWSQGEIDGQEAIRLVKRIWTVGDEEGYRSERGRLAADAMLVAAAHSDAEAAVAWARLAVQWATYEMGSDSDLVEEMRMASQEPKRHGVWGQRSAMRVGGPLARMSGGTRTPRPEFFVT